MFSETGARTGAGEKQFALRLENIGKCFHVYSRPLHRLMQGLYGERKKLYSEYWALQEISFRVERGEAVGIIGRNGAGKSTLLQIICGILMPTTGTLEINGRVAALLELGAGFNPEFTGRENVFLNGAVLGLSQEEIRERFDEIASFADIGDFIEKPVKTYSSGMYIRLAFAVATCVDPDILVVDEALAVGDVKFQAKCFRRFDELMADGTTILFVTHSTEQIVRHCSWSILLEKAKIMAIGDSKKVANQYLDLLFGNSGSRFTANENDAQDSGGRQQSDVWQLDDLFENRSTYNRDEYRWGNGEARIVDYSVTRDGRGNVTSLGGKAPFKVVIAVEFLKDIKEPIFGLTIKTPDGITISSQNSRDCLQPPAIRPVKEGERLQVIFTVCQYLGSGDYLLSVGVVEERDGELVPLDRRYDSIYLNISNDAVSYGLVDLVTKVEVQ